MNAARELFVSVRYPGTTIDAVAQRAGVGRRTVFASVGGKAALLNVVERQSLTGAHAFVAQVERLGGLRPGLTAIQAADLVWAYMMADLHETLVLKRGWSRAAYQSALDHAVAAAILAE